MSLPNLVFGKTGLSSPSVVSVSGATTITISVADAFVASDDIDVARGVLVCEWALPNQSYTLMRLRNSSGTTINQDWITHYNETSIEKGSDLGITSAYRFPAQHRTFQSGHSNFDGYRHKAIIYLINPHGQSQYFSSNVNSLHNFYMEIHLMATNAGTYSNFDDLALGHSRASGVDSTVSSGKVVDIQFFAQTSGFSSQNFSSFHAQYYPLFTRLYDEVEWK